MSRKSRTFILLLLAVAGSWITSAAQTKLLIIPLDGTSPETEVTLGDVRNIKFAANDFTLDLSGVQAKTFAFADVKSIKFKYVETGIDAADTSGAGLSGLYFRDGWLGAESVKDGQTSTAAVYDVSGRAVIPERNWDGSPISVTGLPDGVYVFKVDNQTIKFAK